MKEPPSANRRRHEQQPKHLVAPVYAPLPHASRLLGLLLLVRLDAGFNYGATPTLASLSRDAGSRLQFTALIANAP
jgi:hypothetical protein